MREMIEKNIEPNVVTYTTLINKTETVQEAERLLKEMIETHEQNTQKKVDTAVGDSKYGTIDNFLLCHDLGIKAHMPSLEKKHRGSGRQKGIFPRETFTYHPETDTFTCPVGQTLRRRNYSKKRKHYEYKASAKICAQCELRKKCTRAKEGRTLKRHARQDELDIMLEKAKTKSAKRDIKHRQDLSERSFAWSTRYGFKRAKWRRLWRMEIQDFLIAAIQNITILIKQPKGRISKSNIQAIERNKYLKGGLCSSLIRSCMAVTDGRFNMALGFG